VASVTVAGRRWLFGRANVRRAALGGRRVLGRITKVEGMRKETAKAPVGRKKFEREPVGVSVGTPVCGGTGVNDTEGDGVRVTVLTGECDKVGTAVIVLIAE
jgi:hypothetical protein